MSVASPLVLPASTRRYLARRRGLELLLIAVSTPTLLAVSAVVALAIWIGHGRPVLVRQTRPGRGGRPFTLAKFRTMHVPSGGGAFRLTEDDDPRVTRLGRLLRRSHLDEIPQLWSVVKGDMSLVGPRPVPFELYRDYRRLIPDYDRRHVVRPGLLGYAQVELGYTRDLDGERVKWELDVEYIRRASWRLDARILLAAVGARHAQR